MINPEKKYMDENLGLLPIVSSYIAEQNKTIQEIKELWETSPLIDVPTIMVEGISDKKYLEMAIDELSEMLKNKIDNDELRIVTRKDNGAGTTLIKNWVFAWLHSENKSKLLAVFDKDSAGHKVIGEIKSNELYSQQNQKTNVKVVQIVPSEEIITIYKKKLHIPFEIEHLLSIDIWKRAIALRYVLPRSSAELIDAYKDDLPRNKTIDSILDEKISNTQIRETIANYNPHDDKKMKLCEFVEQVYNKKELTNIFGGFKKTIEILEEYFI